MMLLSNIQICQWRENMFRGEVYHILLDQQWILMWSSVLKVLHYIFCKENFYPHQTKSWPNYIQHKYEKTVTDTKENWIQSNSVSFSRKALLSHLWTFKVFNLLPFKNSLAPFWVPLHHHHDRKKTKPFSLPIAPPPNLSRRLIPLQALGSSNGMQQIEVVATGTGRAASPYCPLPGTSHMAAPVPGTAAVPDSPSVRSSGSRESSLGGKLITEHITFPSPPESCRWESCAGNGDFSSFRARVTVFCSIFFSLVRTDFHVSQLGSSSKSKWNSKMWVDFQTSNFCKVYAMLTCISTLCLVS